MYSFEITDFIEQRNHNISNEEYFMLTDPKINEQIIGTEYKPYENRYYMWSNDGYTWDFNVYKVERVNNNEQNEEECS